MILQEGIEVAENAVSSGVSLVQLIFGGGMASVIIMLALFLMLGISLYIYIERILTIRDLSRLDKYFIHKIKDPILARDFGKARDMCSAENSPTARLLEKGISRIGKSTDEITKAIESAGTMEIYKLEKNVNLLATFSGVGPMIGFLGTVVGMIISFHDMASTGNKPQIEVLSSGIYTAMTTTVAGLVVGIVSYLSYNHLVMKTARFLHQMETDIVIFMDTLNLLDD